MAVRSTFQERLQQMEETRNQRLALLQAERELQSKKSQLLSDKLSNLRRLEQRCLLLEMRNAELGFQILAKKSEIDAVDAQHQAADRRFRALKSDVAEMEGREVERDKFYEMKSSEMGEFKDQVAKHVVDCRSEVQSLRNSVSELKSSLKDFQGRDVDPNNHEITAAETRKAELLATKEDLEEKLATNYQLRSLLQKQLQKTLVLQTEREDK